MRPFLLIALALLAASGAVPAAGEGAGIDLSSDRVVIGGSVRQSRPVEGDLFAMGGNVDVAAAVSGDTVLAGGDVRVREAVKQDLYAAGGNVRVEAAVGRNARLAGGNVELGPTASIGRNLAIAAGTAEIRGAVGGSIEVVGGEVLVDGPVAGDVRVSGGRVELGPNARVAGKLVHHGADVRQDPAAQVAGGLEQGKARRWRGESRHRNGADIGAWLWSLGLIALAGVIAGAFPAGSRRMGEQLRGDPGIGLLLGFIALVCIPIAAVVLAVTIIGIPLALAVLLLYFLMLIVGYAAVGVVIGDAALERLRSQDAARVGWRVAAAMAAMLLLALLTRIPVLGNLFAFAALLAGVGAIVLAIRARTATRRASAAA
jgi:hypothetical protein